jgi:hypothetical protein
LEAYAPKPNEVFQRCILITLHMQVEDIEGVELCGTLKNIVAIAAGVTLDSILCDYIHCFLSEFNGLCGAINLQVLWMAWIWEATQRLQLYYWTHFKTEHNSHGRIIF